MQNDAKWLHNKLLTDWGGLRLVRATLYYKYKNTLAFVILSATKNPSHLVLAR